MAMRMWHWPSFLFAQGLFEVRLLPIIGQTERGEDVCCSISSKSWIIGLSFKSTFFLPIKNKTLMDFVYFCVTNRVMHRLSNRLLDCKAAFERCWGTGCLAHVI